jgi:hypothetical protein
VFVGSRVKLAGVPAMVAVLGLESRILFQGPCVGGYVSLCRADVVVFTLRRLSSRPARFWNVSLAEFRSSMSIRTGTWQNRSRRGALRACRAGDLAPPPSETSAGAFYAEATGLEWPTLLFKAIET